jgi:Glycosyl transferase family 2
VVVYRIGERGFGSAIRRAFREAAGDVMIPIMGDASEDARDVVRLVEAIERGWDAVAGSRYMRGGGIVGNTWKQRLSGLYSFLVRLAGGPKIHDVSNAFKAYRRSVVESVKTVADSFDISVELTVKAAQAGFRITEIPTCGRTGSSAGQTSRCRASSATTVAGCGWPPKAAERATP